MKFLTRVCRLILGAVFVFSGILKLIDPVGTSLVMKEYFTAFHLGFLDFAATGAAVALAFIEFLIGISMLARLRVKFMSCLALAVMSLFTLVTLYLALFNPIADCGCFGEAIHLSNWQTFFKNLILLPCAVVIFIWRRSISEFEHPLAEWAFVLLFALFGVTLLYYVSARGAIMEFSSLQTGNDIAAAPLAGDAYQTTFIYEKEGVRKSFTLDNLPDSTWTFVDSLTEGPEDGEAASDADFYVENATGVDITSDILSRGKLLLLSVYDPEKFYQKHTSEDISALRSRASEAGFDFLTVSSMLYGDDGQDSFVCTDPLACDTFPGVADRKLLMTLNRSNGGLTYLDEGTIIKKWAARAAFSPSLELSGITDSELALLETGNHQRSTIALLLISLLLGYLLKLVIFKFLK